MAITRTAIWKTVGRQVAAVTLCSGISGPAGARPSRRIALVRSGALAMAVAGLDGQHHQNRIRSGFKILGDHIPYNP